MKKNPLISVLCSSFNHEKYVGYFINSLLNQTYKKWELIIIDDCSTDNNVAEIKKFDDNRIRFFQQPFNSGAGIVITRAFEISEGDIIVECASDDALRNDYFEKVVEVFTKKNNVGVIYSSLQIIDYENNSTNHWDLPELNRIKLLKKMFYESNCLFSPGYAIRREFYKLLVPMNFAFIQHQDYQWHIKLLLNTDCELLRDYYVFYRFQESNSVSLSGMNTAGENRYRLEEDYLMNTFLQLKDKKLAEEILGLAPGTIIDSKLIPYYFATSAFKSENRMKRQWGYRTLINFFEDSENFILANKLLGFEFKDLLKISGNDFYSLSGTDEKASRYDHFVSSSFAKQIKMSFCFLLKRILYKIIKKNERPEL